MYHAITPERMRAIEDASMRDSGTPGLLLMERAAQAIAEAALTMTDGGALILCGPGNNGGDGYAAARLLRGHGREAWVWTLSDPEALTGDARANWQRCVTLGIPVTRIASMPERAPRGCGLLVDALFGTGLARPLEGAYAAAARWMNESPLPVLAVDLPSGTAALMVRAEQTVTFHRRKVQHLLFPGRAHSGRVTVAPIGLPEADAPGDFAVLEPDDVPRLLPARAPDAHKGTCGHALLAAGSVGMAGAAALAANAALRGGAGLVTVACPAAVMPIVQTLAPCATCVPLADIGGVIPGKAAIGAGPGLGRGAHAAKALETLLDAPCPQLWDADALNWLAETPRALGERFIITPHPGEAARLLACETAAITADPTGAAEALASRYACTALLKGATTVIACGDRRALNITGTPGMATGGSGDVLSGLISALLAQGLAPFDAARLGALLHGMAGEAAAIRRGVRSMTAADIVDALHID